jgi:phytoene synthase
LITGAREQLATAEGMTAEVAPSARAAFLPIALAKHDLAQMTTSDFDPFALYVRSRLRTLWTLWRASRSKTFS